MSAVDAVETVICQDCDGTTVARNPCQCTSGGDRYLVEEEGVHREPYRDCRVCGGTGSVARACRTCGQTGRRRAQLVITMANLDSGAVASANVVPGVLEPYPWPDGGGHLPMVSLIRVLAATVDAANWYDPGYPEQPTGGPDIFLDRRWRVDLPEPARRALEAEAIANHSRRSWYLLLGRTAPAPPRDPDRELGRLCRVADLLKLDLVVEARRAPTGRLSWTIRFEVPGGEVPEKSRGEAGDLPAAVLGTPVADALAGLAERGRSAPAHYLRTGPRTSSADVTPTPTAVAEMIRTMPAQVVPVEAVGAVDAVEVTEVTEVVMPAEVTPVDVDALERRIVAHCVDPRTGIDQVGAQAIWRDGRWWHTSLRSAGTIETLTEYETGQLFRRRRAIPRRRSQPPAPSWLGPPIPYADCPDCDPGSRLRRCDCASEGRPADPECVRCVGAGWAPSVLACPTCRDSHRIYRGTMVTLSDLATRAVHLTWPASAPVRRLPAAYRLDRLAGTFGVRPEDLTQLDGGHPLGPDLRSGLGAVNDPDVDPVPRHLADVARGEPGGRILIDATRPDVPPLADVIRLALGLRLAVTITFEEHRPGVGNPRHTRGESWHIQVSAAGRPVEVAYPAGSRTVAAAVADCLDRLAFAVSDAVPADPTEPIPVPQNPRPDSAPAPDPVELIRWLGRRHAGQTVAAHLDRTGCQLHLREPDGARHLVTAGTLAGALAALGFR